MMDEMHVAADLLEQNGFRRACQLVRDAASFEGSGLAETEVLLRHQLCNWLIRRTLKTHDTTKMDLVEAWTHAAGLLRNVVVEAMSNAADLSGVNRAIERRNTTHLVHQYQLSGVGSDRTGGNE